MVNISISFSYLNFTNFPFCLQDKFEIIRAAKDAECLAGSVTGLSDQGTILLAKRGYIVHAHFYEPDLDQTIAESVKDVKLFENCKIIVVNSRTERSLSDGARLDYAIPRFANSVGLAIISTNHQKELKKVSDILDSQKSTSSVLRTITTLPETTTINELKQKYPSLLVKIDTAIKSYFREEDNICDTLLPLRGPILFCVAECSRSKKFLELLEQEDSVKTLKEVGKLMNIGHQGDAACGDFVITNKQVEEYIEQNIPIESIPGSFKASTTSLDKIQRILIEEGAIGACLTGAGLGGCVISIFPETCSLHNIRTRLHTEYFSQLPNWDVNNNDVFEVYSVAGACFL